MRPASGRRANGRPKVVKTRKGQSLAALRLRLGTAHGKPCPALVTRAADSEQTVRNRTAVEATKPVAPQRVKSAPGLKIERGGAGEHEPITGCAAARQNRVTRTTHLNSRRWSLVVAMGGVAHGVIRRDDDVDGTVFD